MKISGHTSGTTVKAVVMTFTVIAIICTALRLWTRFGIVRQPGLDDLAITASTVFTIVLSVCMFQQVKYGMGRHGDTLTDNDRMQSLIWFWISIWVYYLALGLAKLSILLQYMRIFGKIPKFRIACFITEGVIIVFTIWTFFTAIFLCVPTQAFWYPKMKARCMNRLVLWFFNSSFNIVTDIATAVLPLPVLKQLNLPRKQRIALMVVFGLGGAICIISIVRFHSLYAIAISKDPSWDNPLAALWATLEVNVGIVASCLPTLKGIFVRFFPKLFSTTHGTGDATPQYELSQQKAIATIGSARGKRASQYPDITVDDEEERIHMKHGGIKVTTIVEQEENIKANDSRENLVPAEPIELPARI